MIMRRAGDLIFPLPLPHSQLNRISPESLSISEYECEPGPRTGYPNNTTNFPDPAPVVSFRASFISVFALGMLLKSLIFNLGVPFCFRISLHSDALLLGREKVRS